MDLMTIAEIIFFVVIGIAIAHKPILDFLEDRFVYRDQGYGRARREFTDAYQAGGLSYGDSQDDLYLLECLATLRRCASDAVRQAPADWFMVLTEAKKASMDVVKERRPDLEQRYREMMGGLSYGQILYPEEARMIDRSLGAHDLSPTEDMVAALRIVRPG